MRADDSRIAKDPICGKEVDTLRARAVGIFGGVTYYFCSAECKAKYVDPRREPRETPSAVSHPPSAPEEKKPEPEKKKKEKPKEERAKEVTAAELHAAAEDEPVRYAHSRMRRITGEVATPVVQIELSPSKKVEQAPAAVEEPLVPARSSRSWIVVAVVMLIIAGGVIWFTLR